MQSVSIRNTTDKKRTHRTRSILISDSGAAATAAATARRHNPTGAHTTGTQAGRHSTCIDILVDAPCSQVPPMAWHVYGGVLVGSLSQYDWQSVSVSHVWAFSSDVRSASSAAWHWYLNHKRTQAVR